MDEIVFQRETLKRKVVVAYALLELAEESYDPSEDIPVNDFVVQNSLTDLLVTMNDYSNAINDRVKLRAEIE